jgi:hypothetical protein
MSPRIPGVVISWDFDPNDLFMIVGHNYNPKRPTSVMHYILSRSGQIDMQATWTVAEHT